MAGVKLIDSSLPKEQRVPFTFGEFARKKTEEIRNGEQLSQSEVEQLNEIYNGENPTTMLLFNRRVSRERLRKWYPELTEADLEKEKANEQSQLYIDPPEYASLVICN